MSNRKGIGYFTRDEIAHIFKSVEINVQKTLGKDVITMIINSAKQISRMELEKNKNSIINSIINDISTNINIMPENIDIHNILNKIINSNEEVDVEHSLDIGTTDISKVEQDTNIKSTRIKKSSYIYLDSRYRSLETDGTTEFMWNLYPGYTDEQGTIGTYGFIKNVTELEIYKFRLSTIRETETDLTSDARLTELLASGITTIRIKEFDSQAVIAHENWSYLFECSGSVGFSFFNVVPLWNNAIYKFSPPITELSKITLSFGNPVHQLTFPEDRLFVYFSGTNGGAGSVATFTTVTGEDINITAGSRVYFTDFSTVIFPVPIPDADVSLIQFMNRKYGQAALVPVGSSFDVEVFDVDTLFRAATLANSLIFIGERRLLMKMRIGYEHDLEDTS